MTPPTTQAVDPAGAVLEALGDVGIDGLHVEAVDGAVYLHGQAPCYESKRRAGERAQLAAPTEFVVNEIRVAHAGFRDDTNLVRDAEAATAAVAGGTPISVIVDRGEVHLHGTVSSAQQRQAVESAVWDACCVERVHNHLQLAYQAGTVDDADIAFALDAYVRRAMNLPPGAIRVGYANGVATLSGIVRSNGQAQAIEDLVRWHERVSDVVSSIHVAMPTSALSGQVS